MFRTTEPATTVVIYGIGRKPGAKRNVLAFTLEMALLMYLYSLLKWILRAPGDMHQAPLGQLDSFCGLCSWREMEGEQEAEGQP